jgi:lipopolysaccharide export system protein LptA
MRIMSAGTLTLALIPLLNGNVLGQDFGAAFAGFDTGSDQPIQIEADRLEVRDQEQLAIYTGNVIVRQGETVLEAPELRVFYTGEPEGPNEPGSEVDRLEAGVGVTVRSGDRTASGDTAVLDMTNDIVTMSGNVILTEGDNVVRGETLVVNLATDEGRMEGGRVQTLISGGGDAGTQ